MSMIKLCEMSEGRCWGVGSFLLGGGYPGDYKEMSPASIVIPVNQIEQMTDEQIGQCVRELVHSAKLCLAEEFAYWVRSGGRLDWENLLPTLEEFEQESEDIAEAASTLRELRARERRRAIAKTTSSHKRKEIRSNYEKLFILLGRRDGFKCAKCGDSTPDLQIDHIIPVAENGTNELENLQLLCQACNINKSDAMPNCYTKDI